MGWGTVRKPCPNPSLGHGLLTVPPPVPPARPVCAVEVLPHLANADHVSRPATHADDQCRLLLAHALRLDRQSHNADLRAAQPPDELLQPLPARTFQILLKADQLRRRELDLGSLGLQEGLPEH